MNKKVLLTGISGYIGLHCAKILLEKGYTVVGTVRSTKRKKRLLRHLIQILFLLRTFLLPI